MKKIIASTSMAAMLVAQSASAQNAGLPIEKLNFVEEETAVSSGNIVIPLIFIIFALAVATGTGNSPMFYVSDERLKTDIRKVGVTPSGISIYQYKYRGQPHVFEGVLAGELRATHPEAVIRADNGFLAVNYDLIDAEFRVVH